MRRATSPIEALMEPESIALARRLGRTAPIEMNRNCMLAAVLAHVREHDPTPLARAAGPATPSGDVSADDRTAKLKHGRFKRLLQSDDDELLEQMRRLVHLLGERANILDLTTSILFWGDRTRRRWVFDYYNVSHSPTPAASTDPAPREAVP